MRLTHEIKVSYAVKKYLDKLKPIASSANSDPTIFAATKDNFIGMWLINSLTRKTSQVKPLSVRKMVEHSLTESWKFSVPSRYEDNLVMPERRVLEFEAMIKRCMLLELIADLENARVKNEADYIQKVLDQFRERYGLLEKELSDERLRKLYLRFRNRKTSLQSEANQFFPLVLIGKI